MLWQLLERGASATSTTDHSALVSAPRSSLHEALMYATPCTGSEEHCTLAASHVMRHAEQVPAEPVQLLDPR